MILCNLYANGTGDRTRYRGQVTDDGVVVYQGPWCKKESEARLDANRGAASYSAGKMRHAVNRKRVIGPTWPMDRN